MAQQFAAAHARQLRGEATPDYFASPLAAERIAQTNPACRLIVVARDPVERAHSHYWFRWNTGRECRSLDEVIASESSSAAAEHDGYLIRHGMYARNLSAFLDRFPSDCLHVVMFEDLLHDPDLELQRCLRFLSVASKPLHFERENAAREARSIRFFRALDRVTRYDGTIKAVLRRVVSEPRRRSLRLALTRAMSRPTRNPVLPNETRRRLADIFAADVHAFRALTRRDLRHWNLALDPREGHARPVAL